MRRLEDQWRLVKGMSRSEKRFLTLLGKVRAGKNGSQQLDLFDYLGSCSSPEDLAKGEGEIRNLSTVAFRLNELIVEGLRMLNADKWVDHRLNKALDEIALLHQREIYRTAFRRLNAAKKLAAEFSRYNHGLELIRWERELNLAVRPKGIREVLMQLREEELRLQQANQELMALRHDHEYIRTTIRQVMVPRTESEMEEVKALALSEKVRDHLDAPNFLERSFAINILATYYLISRQAPAALSLLIPLISDWSQNPEWLSEKPQLFMRICYNFQIAIFTSPITVEEAHLYLEMIPDFNLLGEKHAIHFQRLIYHNRFNLALNTANFELASSLIPEIESWMEANQRKLKDAHQLPFLHNFAVMQFFAGEPQKAYPYVLRILNFPTRKVRTDILDFARVLQVILQFELGNFQLNEYLARSGKRYFKKSPRLWEFESAVIKCLEKLMSLPERERKLQALEELQKEIQGLIEQSSGGIPLLGLSEVQFWVESKRIGKPMRQLFAETVQANQESMNVGK